MISISKSSGNPISLQHKETVTIIALTIINRNGESIACNKSERSEWILNIYHCLRKFLSYSSSVQLNHWLGYPSDQVFWALRLIWENHSVHMLLHHQLSFHQEQVLWELSLIWENHSMLLHLHHQLSCDQDQVLWELSLIWEHHSVQRHLMNQFHTLQHKVNFKLSSPRVINLITINHHN